MKLKYLLYDNTGWFGIQLTNFFKCNKIKYYIGNSSHDIDIINPSHIVTFRKTNIDIDEKKYKKKDIGKNISIYQII
jgi:hypothetical protein